MSIRCCIIHQRKQPRINLQVILLLAIIDGYIYYYLLC